MQKQISKVEDVYPKKWNKNPTDQRYQFNDMFKEN